MTLKDLDIAKSWYKASRRIPKRTLQWSICSCGVACKALGNLESGLQSMYIIQGNSALSKLLRVMYWQSSVAMEQRLPKLLSNDS